MRARASENCHRAFDHRPEAAAFSDRCAPLLLRSRFAGRQSASGSFDLEIDAACRERQFAIVGEECESNAASLS